jgi:hypothetical protein
MASKKRKTSKKRSDFPTLKAYKAWKKRSDASKEGWRGRTKKAIAKQINAGEAGLANMASIRGLDGRPLAIPKRVKTKGLSLAQLEEKLREVETLLVGEILTRGWVDSQDVENLHKDMTVALMPSRLRHLGPLTEAMQRMLNKAFKKGKRALRKQAREYAEFFDVPLREVYTLFFSP